MADIRFRELKMHGGVPLPFTPGYTDAAPPQGPAAAAADAGEAAAAATPLPRRFNPYGGLTLTLTSPPEAEGLAIEYAVVQDGEEMRRDTQELAFSGRFDREGRKIWNLLSMPVPHGAEVRFRVHYRMGGETRVHDDGGREFVATAP